MPGEAQRELFVVEHVTGEWVSSGDNVDYSTYLSRAEAVDAMESEADATDEPLSNYSIVRFVEAGRPAAVEESTKKEGQ